MYISIQLDKSRNFKYGMKALHKIEQTLGIKIAKLDMENLSQQDLAVIIWAGLSHEDAALTWETVMDLIDEHSNITDVTQVMVQAFEAAFGTPDEGKKNRPPSKKG